MGMKVKALLHHLRERQTEYGVNAFNFQNILQGSTLEPSKYPVEARQTIENTIPCAEIDIKDFPLTSPMPTPSQSPKKKSSKGKAVNRTILVPPISTISNNGAQVIDKLVSMTTTQDALESSVLSSTGSSSSLTIPPPHPSNPWNSSQFPPHVPPAGVPPNLYPSFPPYGFPYNQPYISYFLQQQAGMNDMQAPVGDGYHPMWAGPPPFPPANIDPLLLPPGQPTFSFPLPYSQTNLVHNPQVKTDATIQNEDAHPAACKTPSPRKKQTPKRKRSTSPIAEENTPSRSRSGRTRKQTKKYL
jgi:hypothetical protein